MGGEAKKKGGLFGSWRLLKLLRRSFNFTASLVAEGNSCGGLVLDKDGVRRVGCGGPIFAWRRLGLITTSRKHLFIDENGFIKLKFESPVTGHQVVISADGEIHDGETVGTVASALVITV
ncbi:hypothetical protein TYRP_016755 [Tyrophagus putrescentiae]|nr:hypothetical protein TYRP_016755 [Tyrophagus putrescentiae]